MSISTCKLKTLGDAAELSYLTTGVVPDVTGALRFSRILRLNSPNQQQLAGAVCASVLWVQCTESLVSGMERRESAVLDLDDPSTLEGCGYSSLRGLVDHTRLLGCLRCAWSSLLTAQHGAAQHSTAWHSTAHHSTTMLIRHTATDCVMTYGMLAV